MKPRGRVCGHSRNVASSQQVAKSRVQNRARPRFEPATTRQRGHLLWSHPKVPLRGADTFTIARMPALTASGSFGQASTTPARSGDFSERNAKQGAKTFSAFPITALSISPCGFPFSDCGSEGRGFESRLSPQQDTVPLAQEQRVFLVAGQGLCSRRRRSPRRRRTARTSPSRTSLAMPLTHQSTST